MVDSGRKTSFKRKELGGSVVGYLLVKSFKTPNQILKDALNEYDGKEAVNDIANEPKVVAGRMLEPVILKMFMDLFRSITCIDKTSLSCISWWVPVVMAIRTICCWKT